MTSSKRASGLENRHGSVSSECSTSSDDIPLHIITQSAIAARKGSRLHSPKRRVGDTERHEPAGSSPLSAKRRRSGPADPSLVTNRALALEQSPSQPYTNRKRKRTSSVAPPERPLGPESVESADLDNHVGLSAKARGKRKSYDAPDLREPSDVDGSCAAKPVLQPRVYSCGICQIRDLMMGIAPVRIPAVEHSW